nr:MAG TPA: hypothetical protein [Crassvirales sp.]
MEPKDITRLVEEIFLITLVIFLPFSSYII